MTPVATLPADQLLHFLLQVVTLLLLALLLGRLAMRVGLPAIVGELFTGVLLGPSLLGATAPAVSGWLFPASAGQMHLLDAVGQLGVLLLVGLTGAQLDVRMLRERGATGVRVSVAGLIIPLLLGVGAGYLFAAVLAPDSVNRHVFALFLGVALGVSAIPVIAKTLADMGLLHRDIGQLTLAAGMVDDAVAWFLLSVVSALATGGLATGDVVISLLSLVAFLLVAALLGRPATRIALRAAARGPEPGPAVATAVVVILGGAAITHALGLEALFGAFVAGMLIGAPGVVEPRRLAPLRTVVMSVLAPLFLASAGLRMDLRALTDPRVLLAAVAVLAIAIVGKFAGAYLGARTSRLSHWEGLALGAGMNARGVVEVVIALVGLRLGVLTTASYTVIVLVAVVTSVMAPPLLRLAMSRVDTSPVERERQDALAEWSGTTFTVTPLTGTPPAGKSGTPLAEKR